MYVQASLAYGSTYFWHFVSSSLVREQGLRHKGGPQLSCLSEGTPNIELWIKQSHFSTTGTLARNIWTFRLTTLCPLKSLEIRIYWMFLRERILKQNWILVLKHIVPQPVPGVGSCNGKAAIEKPLMASDCFASYCIQLFMQIMGNLSALRSGHSTFDYYPFWNPQTCSWLIQNMVNTSDTYIKLIFASVGTWVSDCVRGCASSVMHLEPSHDNQTRSLRTSSNKRLTH